MRSAKNVGATPEPAVPPTASGCWSAGSAAIKGALGFESRAPAPACGLAKGAGDAPPAAAAACGGAPAAQEGPAEPTLNPTQLQQFFGGFAEKFEKAFGQLSERLELIEGGRGGGRKPPSTDSSSDSERGGRRHRSRSYSSSESSSDYL